MKTLYSNQKNYLHKNHHRSFITEAILFVIVMLGTQSFFGINNTKVNKDVSSFPMFRLKMAALPNYLDECVFYYQEGATNGFDSSYDAYKLFGANPTPHISIDNDSLLMAINGIPPISQTYSTHILATTNITNTFTITADDFQNLPSGTCVFLYDIQTNSTVNLLLNSYIFTLSSSTTNSRFILTITFNTLPLQSNFAQPSCLFPNGGRAAVIGSYGNPWNYVWMDSVGTVVRTTLGTSTADSLENLAGGSYKVEVTSASNVCVRNEYTFNISGVVLPLVAFTTSDTIISSIGATFSTTNLSANCISYYWNFGDGFGQSNAFEPIYNYSVCGSYLSKLIGVSLSGCKDSTMKSVNVLDLATSLNDKFNQKMALIDLGHNQFSLEIGKHSLKSLTINLLCLDGRKIFQKDYEIYNDRLLINLSDVTAGLYLLDVRSKDSDLMLKKIYLK
jgi:hypothetical protein